MSDCGELKAIYVLQAYQGRGIGTLLVDACFKEMTNYRGVSVWVLSENHNAIKFYKRYGFVSDGVKKMVTIGDDIEEIRMQKSKRNQ